MKCLEEYVILYVVLRVHEVYLINGPVAQLVRASPCHGEGRRFESDLGRHTEKCVQFHICWDLSSAGRASALQAEGHRFEPYRSHLVLQCADVAQLAEQLICNQQVIGSSPIIGLVLTFGWIPEWPKGTDCKSAANCFGGSNPPPSIRKRNSFLHNFILTRGGAVWKLVGLITRRS